MNKKRIVLFLIVILTAGLAWWGFFRFKNKSEPLVYENNVEQNAEMIKEEVAEPEDSKEEEKIGQLEAKKEKPVKAEPEAEKEKKVEVVKKESREKLENNIKIKDNLVSWGFAPTADRSIDTIILHSSYNILGGNEYDLDKIILEYKQYGVAPHYVIDREGNIFQLVKDNNIAYHAGESKVPDGRTGVNNFSLGIEIINTEKDKFTSKQYVAVNELIADLKNNYKIKYVLGHDQIAPGRKTDPWNIDWDKIDK